MIDWTLYMSERCNALMAFYNVMGDTINFKYDITMIQYIFIKTVTRTVTGSCTVGLRRRRLIALRKFATNR